MTVRRRDAAATAMFVVTAGGGSAAACLAALDGTLMSVGAVVSWAAIGTRHGAILIHVQGHPDVLVPVGLHAIWVRGTGNYPAAELKPAGRIPSACAAVPSASPPPSTVDAR